MITNLLLTYLCAIPVFWGFSLFYIKFVKKEKILGEVDWIWSAIVCCLWPLSMVAMYGEELAARASDALDKVRDAFNWIKNLLNFTKGKN